MVLEIYVTPYDDIIATEQEGSVATDLLFGNVIDFQIAMPDFDTAPQAYRGYHNLSGQAATFRFAERFIDGRLIGSGGATAVADQSRARIKASFND